jgi:cytochrome P450
MYTPKELLARHGRSGSAGALSSTAFAQFNRQLFAVSPRPPDICRGPFVRIDRGHIKDDHRTNITEAVSAKGAEFMTESITATDPETVIAALMGSAVVADPYPLYHALRTSAPDHQSAFGVRFLSSHALCEELLKSRDFGQSWGHGSEDRDDDSAFIQMLSDSLILSNPPEHTRLRRLVASAFSPRTIKNLAPKIQVRIDELLNRIDSGTVDIVEDFAVPLTSAVVGELLGVPAEDQPQLREWEEAIADAVKPVLDDQLLQRADRALPDFHAYIKKMIADRRVLPSDDLITALTVAEAEGGKLTEAELVNIIFTIMAAGSQTTSASISTGMFLLLQHPAQRQKLIEDPSLIANAVEEMMRFEPAVQNSFMRIALRDTTLGGAPVAEGEHVVTLIGAANRDPAVFDEPDRFLIERRNAKEGLAFGAGVHGCIGRALAVQQMVQTFQTMLRRFPDLQLADNEIEWRRFLPTRQLNHLYVANRT